ncbi:hypothetical protein ACOSQ4_008144 [Xanthoceras sorbifolium]
MPGKDQHPHCHIVSVFPLLPSTVYNSSRKGGLVHGSHMHMMDFLWFAKSRLEIFEFELLCTVMWRVWLRRNRGVHGLPLLPAEENYCEGLLAPAGGLIGLGFAVRNSVGLMVAEALAILYGTRMAVDAGLSPILVKSDALSVINILRNRSFPCSNFGLIIADIFQLFERSVQVAHDVEGGRVGFGLENTNAKVPGEDQHPHSHIVSVSSLLPSTECNLSRKGTSLELVHKYGPCSELKHGKANTPSWSQILLKDQARVRAINARRRYMNLDRNQSEHTKATTLPFGYDTVIGGGEFYAKLDIGTPGQSNYVILDTGSDITWIQCKPCAKCFKQPGPIFDPSKSSTYTTIPCNSPRCILLSASRPPHPRGCLSNKCFYRSGYADGTYTYGYFSQDKLTFKSVNRKSNVIVNNYLLGCGINNSDGGGPDIGVMGLSRAPISFVYQTAPLFKKYFSYCLPSDFSSTGYITFGKPDDLMNKYIKFTPIPTTPQQSQFYDVIITGISVAGKKLPIKSSVYTKGGAVIDSGTVITRLQLHAYAALRSAFRKAMSRYKMAAPDGITDTCYDFSRYETVVVPKVSFFFKGGVELEVDVKGIFLPNSVEQVCLAFAAADKGDGATLGNIMQRSVQVVHDVKGGRVGFGPGTCT